jgi:hypothetical protein
MPNGSGLIDGGGILFPIGSTGILAPLTGSLFPSAPIISQICFPAGTPVQTDQGIIPIQHIIPNIHTIHNKRIVTITKTITDENHLICFEKHSLSKNVPCDRTMITPQHLISHNGRFYKAKDLCDKGVILGTTGSIHKVAYKGEYLYNVLLDTYDTMLVNNMICETLHPESKLAKIYRTIPDLTVDNRKKVISEMNEHFIRENTRLAELPKRKNSHLRKLQIS